MKAEVIDIGRYIKVPYSVLVSQISPRALQVWTRIAADACPESPIVQVHQFILASELRCSTKTIGRAIAELVRNKLLSEEGTWERGRCKIYRINWTDAQKKAGQTKILKMQMQMEIPLESYISVGAHAKATTEETRAKQDNQVKPLEVSRDPQAEGDEEREWIIGRIQADNALRRQRDENEAKKRESFCKRGHSAPTRPSSYVDDRPICPENYPILWGFLRIKWAERRHRVAA